ncbi:MAG: leucine-rich repeat domain-containing protein, partial [Candidatus Coproplasma sp.]
MPEAETHVHTFGNWTAFTDADTPCENRLFFHVCFDCKIVEWKQGEYSDHSWTVVTTPPTCQAQGYDTKTCTVCGKVEVENYTDIVDHAWSTEYSHDNSYHWRTCGTCDEIKDKAEHTPDETGECSVCNALVGATEGVIYDVSADSTYAEVIGYEGTTTRIRIADAYNGLPVKSIYEKAFYQNTSITSVIIPDSVESIGDYAFFSCRGLTSITIPDSVTSIGYSAFFGCSGLTSITIPDSVTSIGGYVFNYCSSLTNVTIGNSLTSIDKNAFSGCNNLLFNEYDNCQYLGSEENPYYVLIQVKNDNYSSYVIHIDTKVIADYAFDSCTRMGSITIPDSVTSIGGHAFTSCSSLTSVTIGKSVTSIGKYAFYYCSSLTSVTIPNSVT